MPAAITQRTHAHEKSSRTKNGHVIRLQHVAGRGASECDGFWGGPRVRARTRGTAGGRGSRFGRRGGSGVGGGRGCHAAPASFAFCRLLESESPKVRRPFTVCRFAITIHPPVAQDVNPLREEERPGTVGRRPSTMLGNYESDKQRYPRMFDPGRGRVLPHPMEYARQSTTPLLDGRKRAIKLVGDAPPPHPVEESLRPISRCDRAIRQVFRAAPPPTEAHRGARSTDFRPGFGRRAAASSRGRVGIRHPAAAQVGTKDATSGPGIRETCRRIFPSSRGRVL
jgi:hypothetical protein